MRAFTIGNMQAPQAGLRSLPSLPAQGRCRHRQACPSIAAQVAERTVEPEPAQPAAVTSEQLVVRPTAHLVQTAAVQKQAKEKGPLSDFVLKVQAAWRIFFPTRMSDMTPKDEGKKRLRMILVADRCGMNQSSLYEMKHSIVQVVSEFVEIEAEELVDVNISADSDVGTIYTVNVPVRRVKPQARLAGLDGEEVDGVSMEWDTSDPDADPSNRFPYGC